jgi:hypothetical protein
MREIATKITDAAADRSVLRLSVVSSTSPSAPAGTAPWLDEGGPNPSWPPPARPSPQTRRVLGPGLVYAALGLALALVVVAIWGFGGFKRRTDLLIVTPPGTVVSTGPYELAFTEATAQRKVDSTTNEVSWTVEAVGTGRTTGDISLAPEAYDDGMFASKDPASGETQESSGFTMGASGKTDRRAFTPGVPPIPYTVSFNYSGRYVPGPTLRFLVNTLTFSDTSLLRDGKKSWHNALYAYETFLPVRVLPPRDT